MNVAIIARRRRTKTVWPSCCAHTYGYKYINARVRSLAWIRVGDRVGELLNYSPCLSRVIFFYSCPPQASAKARWGARACVKVIWPRYPSARVRVFKLFRQILNCTGAAVRLLLRGYHHQRGFYKRARSLRQPQTEILHIFITKSSRVMVVLL